MDIFSLQFLYALGAIVLIDLVLAGDNAIVIALAARKLPPTLQKRAVVWGTVGAIVVRSIMTVGVVWLLKVPGLMLAGGALLLWIAVKLLLPDDRGEDGSHDDGSTSFWGAMKTIVIADAVMGLDNVLAVAGAAQGSFLLVTLGLLISIPIVVWGSTLILKWVERFPIIVYAGAGILALTAAKMMLNEPLIETWFVPYQAFYWPIVALTVIGVLGSGYFIKKSRPTIGTRALVLTSNRPQTQELEMNHPSKTVAQNILLPINDSASSKNALSVLANRLASRNPGADELVIHLLHVSPKFNRHITRFIPAALQARFLRERAETCLPQAVRILELAGIKHEIHLRMSASISREILKTAKQLNCHQIVLGSRRSHPIAQFLTNSLTSRLLSKSPIPIEIILGGDASFAERLLLPASIGLAFAVAIAD